jgi:hypothetical protein
MTRSEALKQLMLGLIYPAVLGTVFYAVLGRALDQALSIPLHWSAFAIAPWLKWALVLTTLTFYGCDYLYVMFTKKFRPMFFVCDLILLAGLYVTFSKIDIGTPLLPHRNMVIVARCYAVFMFLYLIWDVSERRATPEKAEKRFYGYVVIWEIVSLLMLFAWLRFEPWIPSESCRGAVLASVLFLITIPFVWLAQKKRTFYLPPDQPQSPPA